MTTLFKKTYDSESIVDMGRDVHEAFDQRFNENASKITQESSVLAHFYFKNEEGQQDLLQRVYDENSYHEVASDMHDSFDGLVVEPNEHGFFDGDLVVELTIQ